MAAPTRIRVLNDQTINKIAAGEVIENPASVVKELVENSIDAGASTICVEIQEGGRQLIRITDDGCGMSQDDALLSLERHATSKIREVEDIEELMTMGFRGEAVPSIAAISKFSLLSCPRLEGDAQITRGTLIQVDGGRVASCASAPRSPGTTIEVKSLFFNVPVRRKFQKSPSFDTQEILKMLGLLALGHPTVQFELISDQKTILKTASVSKNLSFEELLGQQIKAVLGSDFASSLIPLKFKHEPYELEGFIGSPMTHKPNRTGQHLFINQRPVYSPLIASAIREGYGTMLPNLRYPVFVLHLRMPGTLLDVNVHPQKKEVRLRQEHQLKEMIMQGVQTALRREQRPVDSEPGLDEAPPPYWASKNSFFSPQRMQAKAASEEKWEYQTSEPSPPRMPEKNSSFDFPPPPFAPAAVKTQPVSHPSLLASQPAAPRILATLLGYCILDPFCLDMRLFALAGEKKEGGLALLDQRAAYSRIHYDQLLKRLATKETQALLIPLTLQTTPAEAKIIHEHLAVLNHMGFGIREFGENTFMVDAFPSFLKQDQLQNCLNLLIQDLVEMQTTRRLQMQKEEQLALAACRASLPSTKQLSLEEAQGLLQELLKCGLPAQCPMGKPTCLYLSPDELSKWFQKANQG